MKKAKPGTVLLLSGGLDSTILLHYLAVELKKEVLYVLSFSYGQKHEKELAMARWQAGQQSSVVEHRVIALDFFSGLLAAASTLVDGGDLVPDLADVAAEECAQPPTYVPNRNMILLALAAAYAEARGCGEVYYGAQAQDRYGYWDCTDEFLQKTNAVLGLNRGRPVMIKAPFIGMRKAEEIAIGSELGVDFSRTWSCYRGGEKHCGTCPTCVERRQGFKEAGLKDPVEYLNQSQYQ